MLDDHRPRRFWLRSVKGVHLLVDGRERLGFVNKPLYLGVAGLGGKQSQRRQADVRLQRFPGLIAYRACSTSWTTLLDLSGDRPINSLSAATTIQKAG